MCVVQAEAEIFECTAEAEIFECKAEAETFVFALKVIEHKAEA